MRGVTNVTVSTEHRGPRGRYFREVIPQDVEVSETDRAALRRCVLAVAVLHDVDLVPDDEGVRLESGRLVPWSTLALALRPLDPQAPAARARLARWLVALRMISWRSPEDLGQRARPVGLPVTHGLHPGLSWIREPVRGGAIHLGLGFLGVGAGAETVHVLPPGVIEVTVGDRDLLSSWWVTARAYLDEMGALAAERYLRHPGDPLRPMGDCDVVTLLASEELRTVLVGGAAQGLRAAAVPTRRRGWLDLSRTDPAFALVAASLAEADDRGFPRPLLITRDEITMAREGGDPVLQALREQSAPDPVVMPMSWS
jgi:hypothetical protein